MRLRLSVYKGEEETSWEERVETIAEIKAVMIRVVSMIGPWYQRSVRQGMQEMVMNAVEHGVLGIDGSEKRAMKQRGYAYYGKELANRLKGECEKESEVRIVVEEHEQAIRVMVRDSGTGFDWKEKERELEREEAITEADCQGRGLQMMKMSVDQLLFNEQGNEVTAVLRKDEAS